MIATIGLFFFYIDENIVSGSGLNRHLLHYTETWDCREGT